MSPFRRSLVTRLVFILLMTVPCGCITLAPRSQSTSPQAQLIDGVPARRWADNSCAAGALSEVLNSFGDPVSEQALSSALPRGRRGGVISVDLLIAARNRGFDARLLRGDLPVVRTELERGNPLILMLRVMDARGSSEDLFHYVVLSGFDRGTGLVCMHFGDGKRRWVSLEQVGSSWAAGGHATFLIEPRRRRVATEDDLRRAAALEADGRLSQAVDLYEEYLASHPTSVVGWTNLGNAQLGLGEEQLAEVAYRNALFLNGEYRDALNNLAWMLLQDGRLDEAEALARVAASEEGRDQELVLDTLAHILNARGDCREAIATFEKAILSVADTRSVYQTKLEYGLGLAQRDCGFISEARRTLESALRREPESELEGDITVALQSLPDSP